MSNRIKSRALYLGGGERWEVKYRALVGAFLAARAAEAWREQYDGKLAYPSKQPWEMDKSMAESEALR